MERHNLHVKIDKGVRQRLEGFCKQLGLGNVSCLVKKLIERSRPVMEQRYFEEEEQASHYEFVNPDLSLDRVSLHIFLMEEDYRWLKQNHQDLNFFSIAQVVRWIIDWGVALLELGIDEAKRQWRKIAKAWEKKWRVVHGKMEKVKQLYTIFQSKPQEFGWVSLYNRGFSPLREIFLKR